MVRATLSVLTARKSAGGLGMRAVVLNSRGCNRSPVTTPKLYNAGTTDDIRTAVLWIAKNFPESPIFGIGFSLGANAMTKYVGEEGDACPLTAAVVLANPWDFVRSARHIESATLMNKYIYKNVMGGAVRSLVARHREAFLDCPNPPLPADVVDDLIKKRFVSLRYFDNTVTAPVFGFANADHYYASVSSSRFVASVRIPLLGLNAEDDPVIGDEALPQAEILMNPWVYVVRTAHGGHLGWFEKGPDGALRRWYVRPVREYFEALLDYNMAPRPRVPFHEEDGRVTRTDRPDISFYELDAKGLPQGTNVEESTSAIPFASRIMRKLFTGW
ncbi:Alpha/Beta hydrolase protein [Amylostereum chailletii]|nr:Alpha/Beta hydrolase protein [Amylostereum chailletii]